MLESQNEPNSGEEALKIESNGSAGKPFLYLLFNILRRKCLMLMTKFMLYPQRFG
jgi:hypothetical protein